MIVKQLEVQILSSTGEAVMDAKVAARETATGRRYRAEPDRPRQLYFFTDLRLGRHEVLIEHERLGRTSRLVQVQHKPSRATFVMPEPEIRDAGEAMTDSDPGRFLTGILAKPKEPTPGEDALLRLLGDLELERAGEAREVESSFGAAPGRTLVVRHPGCANLSGRAARASRLVHAAGPVVGFVGEHPRVLTNQLLVRFVPEATAGEIAAILDEHDLRAGQQLPVSESLFLVEADPALGEEVEEVAAGLREDRRVLYAEALVVEPQKLDGPERSSFLWPGAWDRRLAGIAELREMEVPALGEPSVIVAVIDTGIPGTADAPEHRDFAGRVHALFDFENMTPDCRPVQPHGVMCMGVAVGKALGAAPNCRLIAAVPPISDHLRRFQMYCWCAALPVTFPNDFPRHIAPGADVLAVSVAFHTSSPALYSEDDLYSALARRGRGGKGCLVFVSAGNEDTNIAVSRPAGLSEFNFACGATTLKGGREVHAPYSGRGQIEWCAPSSTEAEGPVHSPPERYATWTAALNGSGVLPSEPWVVTLLREKADAGVDSLQVAEDGRFLKGTHLLLESPHHPDNEAISIVRGTVGREVDVAKLARAHSADAQVTLGFKRVAQLKSEGAIGQATLELDPAPDATLALAPADEIVLWNGSPDNDPEIVQVKAAPGTGFLSVSPLTGQHQAGTDVYVKRQNYTNAFGGTSSATSLCAGIGALVLSANPDLTWVEAREILRSTAEQIDATDAGWLDKDGVPVAESHGAPVFNEKYGYGRLNAAAAVEAALLYSGTRDLMIRSSATDTGDTAVPDPGDSPDIWVRSIDPLADTAVGEERESHQAPQYGRHHWVFARVRNRGTEPGLDAWIRFYVASWHGRPFVFPEDWEPSNGRGNRHAEDWQAGTYFIDEVAITGVEPGDEKVVYVPWPAALLPPARRPDGSPWEPHLLVEITPHDGPLKGIHVGDNNNLGQRRVEILSS